MVCAARVRAEVERPLRDSENTSWKKGSPLGKSTVDPRVMATTRGTKVSLLLEDARAAAAAAGDVLGASWMKTMTLDSSDSGLAARRLDPARRHTRRTGGAVDTGR